MAKENRKSLFKWIAIAAVVAVAAFIGVKLWMGKKNALPEGIASGNGRIEAKLVDVAAREPLKVKEVLVAEGDMVKPGQVLVRLDTATLNAEMTEAAAKVVSAEEKMGISKAAINSRKSEISLAETELRRAQNLVKQGAGSQRELDVRVKNVETARAALAEEQARLAEATQDVETNKAAVATIRTRITDATLLSPVRGRVLYRLAEPGEVLAPGGAAITLVDLGDVYMEVFLPSNQAAALKVGSEARIVMDYLPDRAVPAKVTFVSPEAQFTPKQVETQTEREMLMFRVKLEVPQELVLRYVDQIKTGVRGVGYIKVDPEAEWPERLSNVLTVEGGKRSASVPPAPKHPSASGTPAVPADPGKLPAPEKP